MVRASGYLAIRCVAEKQCPPRMKSRQDGCDNNRANGCSPFQFRARRETEADGAKRTARTEEQILSARDRFAIVIQIFFCTFREFTRPFSARVTRV